MSFLFCFSFLPTYSSLWFFLFPSSAHESLYSLKLCVDGAAPSLLCSQQRGCSGSPLLFIWVVQRPHRNICFPNNHYSQWGPNAPGLSAFVLQFLVASWWLLKQITARSDGSTQGAEEDRISFSYPTEVMGWSIFSSIIPCPGFSSPPHSLSHPMSAAFLFLLSAGLFSFL